jgi:hypothetical protein
MGVCPHFTVLFYEGTQVALDCPFPNCGVTSRTVIVDAWQWSVKSFAQLIRVRQKIYNGEAKVKLGMFQLHNGKGSRLSPCTVRGGLCWRGQPVSTLRDPCAYSRGFGYTSFKGGEGGNREEPKASVHFLGFWSSVLPVYSSLPVIWLYQYCWYESVSAKFSIAVTSLSQKIFPLW